jgi:hypothetical protein
MAAPRKGTTTAGDPICSFDAQNRQPPKASLSITTVLDHDLTDVFLPNHGDTVIEVAGFPALQQRADAAGPRPCTVGVSPAEGKFVEVVLNYSSTEAHLSVDQACELTIRAATFAMQTLQTLR